MTKAEELINKHLDRLNANNIIGKDGNIYKGFLNAINEALTITDVGCSETELVCEHDWQTIFYQDTKIIGKYCPECDEFEAY